MIQWRALLLGNDPGCGCERVRSQIDLALAPEWPERIEHDGKRYQIVPNRRISLTNGAEQTVVYTQAYLEIGA